MRAGIAIGLCLVLIGGCDSKPPEKTVFDTQTEALKKAREVDKTVQDAVQRQREQIERETQK